MNWSSAKEYCSNLTIDKIDSFRLPTVIELRNLRKFDHHFNFLARDLYWSSMESTENATKVSSSYSLSEYHHQKWQKESVRCVTGDRNDVKHLSFNKLTENIFNSRITRERHLKLSPKPTEPIPRHVQALTKKEFETTEEFNQREIYSKTRIEKANRTAERKYDKALEKWQIKNNTLKRKHQKKIAQIKANKNKIYLDSLKKAFSLKYGSPHIKNVRYDADHQVFHLEVFSDPHNMNFEYGKLKNVLLSEVTSSDYQMRVTAVYQTGSETILKFRRGKHPYGGQSVDGVYPDQLVTSGYNFFTFEREYLAKKKRYDRGCPRKNNYPI